MTIGFSMPVNNGSSTIRLSSCSLNSLIYNYSTTESEVKMFEKNMDLVESYLIDNKYNISKQSALDLFGQQRSLTKQERQFYNSVNKKKMAKSGVNIFTIMRGNSNDF